jgi:hypothetical protein
VKALCAWLALALSCTWASSQDGAGELKLSGYAKSLLTDSRTVVGPDEPYELDLNRLRLEVKGPLAPWLAVDLQVDNELLLGDYLGTQQFQVQKALPPQTYWNAHANWLDAPRAYGEVLLYRGSLTASFEDTDFHVGRQRIAWGTGRFWSPMDLLNPFSPVALERAERVGVDALLIEHKVNALSRLAFVYAPQRDTVDSDVAVMWHDNRHGIDYSVMGGRFAGDRVIGADLASQVGEAGIRAEVTQTWPDAGASFARVLLGLDYAFANTLTLSVEAFYDGSGTLEPAQYNFAALFSGRVQNLAQHYLGASAYYEITPLWKTRHDVVLNLDDHSRYYSPSLSYSISSNLDATLGAQFFGGAEGTEFGAFRRVLYAQVQWFF